MSRIHEAWQRTEGRGLSEHGTGAWKDAHGALEQYPREEGQVADRAVSDAPRLRARVASVPTNAAVPSTEAPAARAPVNGRPEPALASQYLRVVAALQQARATRILSRVLVTSAVPREEKTTVTADLALHLSRAGARVLIVDSDPEQPSLCDLFGVHDPQAGGAAVDTRTQPLLNLAPHIWIATVGHDGSGEMPGARPARVRDVVERCGGEFDWVLVNAPPVALWRDAPLAPAHSGAVVFVIGADTPFAQAEKAMTQIGRSLIAGTILRGISES